MPWHSLQTNHKCEVTDSGHPYFIKSVQVHFNAKQGERTIVLERQRGS